MSTKQQFTKIVLTISGQALFPNGGKHIKKMLVQL
jgi:hypothetical protein